MKLWQKVTLGLILGIIFGIYLPQYVNYIKPIGDIFLRLIKMIITPLIFFSLVSGITSMNDTSALGRVGMKAVAAFLGTTFFATIFGLTIALALKPGVGIHIDFTALSTTGRTSFNIIDFFVNIIPENAVMAFANGNILQVVFFAIFVGITLNKMKSIDKPITDLIHAISKLILKMISFVIQLSPYGAFALTGWIIGMQGFGVMISLSKLVVAVIVAMTCQYLVFGLLIYIFCRVSPIPFYKKSFEYQILAFSTSSSKATLATTMQVCREKLGISESSTSFVLPIGASINMDGFAINLSLTTIFFAQMMGITLAPHDYLVIILTSTLGSIGGAGIPGASLIMLPMVLSSVHLPIEGVAIIAGIDRILDMLRTTINITGDATITMIIDNSEDTLDKKVYLS
ncbi:dicarboxylate/amino acid:cation symporter [Rickettsia typhi]|uniref:Proton/sodium glutamate symporter n=2 Tax=Rickettsia typhi TaxID=785 RepID=Q68XJ1_RICTY|nr:dicarboxylate/amino acid:cation symporter [Rickettsia typhi]AAU03651.1 proton/sodium glutamate symporter [Rickettsia typhi str. Wilmington]AFE54029.1 proton/sodium glutamate symporter [Rickettsia typhi str. TH1527]AFE54868.1 proton/sodium glutamate symporter [Rickettsia typhi str. B9991CWPP]